MKPEGESLHEKLMEVVMNHGADATGLHINMAETIDALGCAMSWVLALSPDLTNRKAIKQTVEAINRSVVRGVVDAQAFNREQGVADMIRPVRFQ